MSESPPLTVDVVIVGGGMTGLAIADHLRQSGIGYRLIESRSRLGGRVLSCRHPVLNTIRFDLGPAWIWPGQPRVHGLIQRFDLRMFEQFATGRLAFQDETGIVRRDLDFAMMAGALRIDGGMQMLVDRLAEQSTGDQLQTATAALAIRQVDGHVLVETARQQTILARICVLAMPPRLASRSIRFTPQLGADVIGSMAAIPTWMAGHAKFLAIYQQPFWRRDGLSGDGISRHGPLVQIHDASPMAGDAGALFGFFGLSANHRNQDGFDIKGAAIAQLVALFGPQAASPTMVEVMDWALEADTATDDDQTMLGDHPAYGLPRSLAGIWNDRLILASAELSAEHGGLIEGALDVADRTSRKIESLLGGHL